MSVGGVNSTPLLAISSINLPRKLTIHVYCLPKHAGTTFLQQPTVMTTEQQQQIRNQLALSHLTDLVNTFEHYTRSSELTALNAVTWNYCGVYWPRTAAIQRIVSWLSVLSIKCIPSFISNTFINRVIKHMFSYTILKIVHKPTP